MSLNERDFTELETKFLSIFFTGVETREPVYAAKASVSSPLWTFLSGGYSRTQVTMREKFLVSVREIAGDDEHYTELLQSVVAAETTPEILSERVEKFLSKWAVEYGHNSLKDSCQDRFAIECVSIRGAKILERDELGAYQEKSTRYVDFSKVEPMFYLIPEGHTELLRVHEDAMRLYTDLTNSASEHYMASMRHLDVQVASRTARAKAFDVARYVLPAYLPTALGGTFTTRSTERVISHFLGHKYPEIRDLGAALLRCGVEVNPALLRHVTAKPQAYVDALRGRDFDMLACGNLDVDVDNAAVTDHTVYVDGDVRMTCAGLYSPLHPRWAAPAALLAEARDCDQLEIATSLPEFAATQSGSEALRSLWVTAFAGVGQHDEYPEALDAVHMHFQGLIDFGAYRDLQRHRRGHQPDARTDVNYGYSVPCVLDELDPELVDRYHRVMCAMTVLRKRLPEDQATYALLLGHKVRFSYTCSLRQALYIVRLRTQPAGHESYRAFAQSMARTIIEAVPELAPVMAADFTVNTDRSAAEARTLAKLKALQQEGSHA